jgi:hypothetical protein
MAKWLSFAGVIITVEAPGSTPEHEVAALARSEFLRQLQDGPPVLLEDVGVGDIQQIGGEHNG